MRYLNPNNTQKLLLFHDDERISIYDSQENSIEQSLDIYEDNLEKERSGVPWLIYGFGVLTVIAIGGSVIMLRKGKF
jgi:hypothetical protein